REVAALLHEVERLREVRLRVEERRRELGRAVQQLSSLGILAETAGSRALLMGVQRALSADGEEAGDIVASMEEQLKAICTLPLRTVLEPLRRSVRDLCKQSGKLARLSVVGGEMSLDRRVLESLRAPLIALVRNAVDHGLELPDLREQRGKHREGIVVVRAELQGHIEVESTAGQGTRFTLTLPAELGSSPVLVVRSGEHQLGIPMPAIETSLLASSSLLRVSRGRVQLSHREQLIPVQDAGALLGLRQPEVPHDGQPLLVLSSQASRLALAV